MTRAEPPAVVQQTIEALLVVKSHADEILIIDNNHTNEALYKPLEQYCNSLPKSIKVRFHHIDDVVGYKAGALNLALQMMDKACDYIVVVDSDYQLLPWARERIKQAVKRFPDHALLQFPQYYRDRGRADIHAELNHYFSYHLNKPNNRQRALSTGTCAVIKKDALVRVGGWCSDSITEDAQMGVLLHLNGERTQYVNEVIATGMLPLSIVDLIAQRRRWVYGNVQVLRNYSKILRRSKQLGLSNNAETVNTMKLAANSSNKIQDKHSVNKSLPFRFLQALGFNSVRYLRAHVSQLNAWINLTGVFILLQALGIGGLIVNNYVDQESLLSISLTALQFSFAGYAVFISRRLWAYLSDSKPLTVPDPIQTDISASSSIKTSPFKSLVAKLRVSKADRKTLTHKTSIIHRLRAWVVHLNFWEIGALSWLPVLWGQQKPFICTPKVNTHPQNTLKNQWLVARVLPKLLTVLNIGAVIMVWPHSKALTVCALSIIGLKLAAAAVLMSNYSESNVSLSQPTSNSLERLDSTELSADVFKSIA